MHGMAGLTQAIPHTPVIQVGCAFTAPSQTVPHVPQFEGSVCVSTQLPEQLSAPFGHDMPQLPFEHTRPAPQAVSQLPQCAPSVCVSTHSVPHSV